MTNKVIFDKFIYLLIIALPFVWGQSLDVATNVLCKYNEMAVTFDTNSETLKPMFSNNKREADVYVKNHKETRECKGVINNNNKIFKIPIDKTKCGVDVIYLEPAFTSVQASIIIQERDGQFKVETLAYCLFKSLINGTLGNDKKGISGTVPPFHVDNSTVFGGAAGEAPEPQLHVGIEKEPGKSIERAKLGDPLVFNLTLVGDSFNAIQPTMCEFSEDEPHSKKNGSRIRFVQDSCPLPHLTGIIKPMRRISPTSYVSNFTTFRFRNAKSLYVFCIIKLCVKNADCNKTCLDEQPKKKTKRSIDEYGIDRVEISRKLDVIAYEGEKLSSGYLPPQSPKQIPTNVDRVCMATSSYWGLLITLCAVILFLIICFLVILCLLCRLRRWSKKSNDQFRNPLAQAPYRHNSFGSSQYADSVYSMPPSVRFPRASCPPTPRL